MSRHAHIGALAAIALAFAGCNQAPGTHDADVKAIADTEARWNADFAARDADKITSHYTSDAVYMGPGWSAIDRQECHLGG